MLKVNEIETKTKKNVGGFRVYIILLFYQCRRFIIKQNFIDV